MQSLLRREENLPGTSKRIDAVLDSPVFATRLGCTSHVFTRAKAPSASNLNIREV